jgi:hypothetical protein
MIQPPHPQVFDDKEDLVHAPVDATYHSRLRAPAWAHPTRESASHAIRCLASADPADHAVGCRILERLLPLQVTDPTDLHYGIWGWYAEEPPAEMAPADWNWADFMGVRLLQILHDYPARLPADLAARTRAAAEHAAWSIFRRNVGPGYTNICAMGAVVCLAAGEMFSEPLLVDYARRRLHNMRRELEFHGGFPEYNSPTYTLVVLEEFERLLHLTKQPEARADAETILKWTWRLIASQFHPGTGQWAGAQSRNYQDYLDPHKRAFFETRLGRPLATTAPADSTPAPADPEFPFPCPEEVRVRFFQLPAAPLQYRHTWLRKPDGEPRQVSTTWFTADATLGSMDAENLWNQRRVILGYWRDGKGQPARVRLRVLHNGRDFVSASSRNAQEKGRILTGFSFTSGNGDYHPYFDRPAHGTFRTRDLRIRYEVEGDAVRPAQLAPDLFELAAGGHKIVVRTGPLRFDGKPAPGWSLGGEGRLAWLDGVFYSGPERDFHPGEAGECTAAASLELLTLGEEVSPHGIQETTRDGERFFRWQADEMFEVSVPTTATSIN